MSPALDPAEPQRDEGQVEGAGQAPAEPLAHQLGRAVGAVGPGREVDRDRHVELAVAPHDVVRAGEDEPLDAGQGRGVEHVGQHVEVRPLQLLPGGELVGVGRQVDHRVDAVEVGDPVVVELAQVGLDHVGIVGAGRDVDQDEVVDVGPGRAELAADVAAGAGDQDGARLVLELLVVLILGVGLDDRQSRRAGRVREMALVRDLVQFVFQFELFVGSHGGSPPSGKLRVTHRSKPISSSPVQATYFGDIWPQAGEIAGTRPSLDLQRRPQPWVRTRMPRTLATASRKKNSPHMTDSSTPSFLWK